MRWDFFSVYLISFVTVKIKPKIIMKLKTYENLTIDIFIYATTLLIYFSPFKIVVKWLRTWVCHCEGKGSILF
jgi:hypothetical protein